MTAAASPGLRGDPVRRRPLAAEGEDVRREVGADQDRGELSAPDRRERPGGEDAADHRHAEREDVDPRAAREDAPERPRRAFGVEPRVHGAIGSHHAGPVQTAGKAACGRADAAPDLRVLEPAQARRERRCLRAARRSRFLRRRSDPRFRPPERRRQAGRQPRPRVRPSRRARTPSAGEMRRRPHRSRPGRRAGLRTTHRHRSLVPDSRSAPRRRCRRPTGTSPGGSRPPRSRRRGPCGPSRPRRKEPRRPHRSVRQRGGAARRGGRAGTWPRRRRSRSR